MAITSVNKSIKKGNSKTNLIIKRRGDRGDIGAGGGGECHVT